MGYKNQKFPKSIVMLFIYVKRIGRQKNNEVKPSIVVAQTALSEKLANKMHPVKFPCAPTILFN